jgi:D-arabinose 1-dehydrogenase-like Zn-dependent alcohol dehydrogenase
VLRYEDITISVLGDQDVLINVAAVQLAKAANARVIATASDGTRPYAVQEHGADHVIDYTTSDVATATLDVTAGRGVDLLVDVAGDSKLNQLTAAVRYGDASPRWGSWAGRQPSTSIRSSHAV